MRSAQADTMINLLSTDVRMLNGRLQTSYIKTREGSNRPTALNNHGRVDGRMAAKTRNQFSFRLKSVDPVPDLRVGTVGAITRTKASRNTWKMPFENRKDGKRRPDVEPHFAFSKSMIRITRRYCSSNSSRPPARLTIKYVAPNSFMH